MPLFCAVSLLQLVKVWNLNNCKLRTNLVGHTGYVNTVTVSPDGSLCASGGKDGVAMLWDLNEGRHLSNLEAGDTIHALCFSPIRYWLCAATASTIKIWDLESRFCVDELKPEFAPTGKKAVPIQCISLAWSADGATLFAGQSHCDRKPRTPLHVAVARGFARGHDAHLALAAFFAGFVLFLSLPFAGYTDSVVRVYTVTAA